MIYITKYTNILSYARLGLLFFAFSRVICDLKASTLFAAAKYTLT